MIDSGSGYSRYPLVEEIEGRDGLYWFVTPAGFVGRGIQHADMKEKASPGMASRNTTPSAHGNPLSELLHGSSRCGTWQTATPFSATF